MENIGFLSENIGFLSVVKDDGVGMNRPVLWSPDEFGLGLLLFCVNLAELVGEI